MLRNIILNDGNKIPMVGFGTYKATDGTGYKVVLDAIKAGYDEREIVEKSMLRDFSYIDD